MIFGHENAIEPSWSCAAHPCGYAWWYIDVSDGRHVLSAILFAGSVFSPSLAARVRKGSLDRGLDHPAVNLALYHLPEAPGCGPPQQIAWVMNEYPGASLARQADGLRVGHSTLTYGPDGTVLLEFAEPETRFFGRAGPLVRGRVLLRPEVPAGPAVSAQVLSGTGTVQHFWRALAIRAQAAVEVETGRGGALRFSGGAYHDCNYGSGRLEDAFSRWGWAHGTSADRAAVLYRTWYAGGGGCSITVLQGPHGTQVGSQEHVRGEEGDAPALPRDGFRWLRVPARFHAGDLTCERLPGGCLEDTPFYARFGVTLRGAQLPPLAGVGEYLDLERFRSRGVQHLLRYKTRRMGP